MYLFGVCLILLFGCTLPAEVPQNETDSREEGKGPEISFESYENIGVSFDYPEGARMAETLSNYPAYAVIAIGDNVTNSSLLFVFMNMSSVGHGLEGTSEELAKDFLESSSKHDNIGVLHQATSKGEISTYKSPGGFSVAEMEFSLRAENLDKSQASASKDGYALEIYDTEKQARYGVRIFADEMETAKMLKERFVSSFRYSNKTEESATDEPDEIQNETVQVNETLVSEEGACIDSELTMNESSMGCVEVDGIKFIDRCLDRKTALEYYCDGNNVANKTVTCTGGNECYKNACRIKGCYAEYVAYSSYKKETVNITGYDITDKCKNSTHVTDYYCDRGYVVSVTSNCPEGYLCSDGKCMGENKTQDEENVTAPDCFDSDYGMAIRTKGKITGLESSYEDSCVDGKTLKEYYCENDTIEYVIEDCGTGFRCEDGSCKLGAPAEHAG